MSSQPPARLSTHLTSVMGLDPSAPALEFEQSWWTWAQLSALADAINSRLDELNIPPGGEVGLLVRNRPQHVATILAILTSQRCIVMFNPIDGDVRVAEEIDRRGVPVLIASDDDWSRSAVIQAASQRGTASVALGPAQVALLERPTASSPPGFRPGVAIEMLTSGTTGRPKRVDIGYQKIWQALVAARTLEGRDGEDPVPRLRSSVTVVHSPIVHTSGQWRLLETLFAGRRTALLERFTVDGWVDLVKRHRPSTSSLVPAALRMVLDARPAVADLASLRAVVSGTAPLSPSLADEFEARYGIPVLSVYGATEFAGGIAAWTLPDKKIHGRSKRGSVGRAIAGIDLRVVDESSGQPVSAGTVGVLEARGSQLVDDGWVRTTDLASIDEDEFVFLHGRSDSVIIRGGFKVHPESVEAVLESHPRISAACVLAADHPRLGQVPIAVVEHVAGQWPPTPDELSSYARERLTAYQVPEQIVVLDALPRTPSMKIARGQVADLVRPRLEPISSE